MFYIKLWYDNIIKSSNDNREIAWAWEDTIHWIWVRDQIYDRIMTNIVELDTLGTYLTIFHNMVTSGNKMLHI